MSTQPDIHPTHSDLPDLEVLSREKRNLEVKLEDLRARLSEVEAQSRAKDEFLATLSHELRTPLNAMRGWAELLAKEELDDVTFARAIQSIERNTKLQAQLIDDLLDVSRVVSGKLRIEQRPLDLIPVVATAVDGFRRLARERGVNLSAEIDPARDMVAGDRSRLEQVIGNLVANALQYTPRGGSITVSVGADGDQRISVRVRDTGRGIAPDLLPHVFERFRQGDTSSTTMPHRGLGLGLAIAKHIVELHGGAIRAESEGEGKGATFVFWLPVLPATPRAPRPRPPSRADSGRRRHAGLHTLTVLVVDDEPDARDLMTTMLGQFGARVVTASSVNEALEQLATHHPDVIVSDIAMPTRDGYALINRVRALPPEAGGTTPAIALTAYAAPQDRSRALSAGFDRHLSKPIDADLLVSAILDLGERRVR